MKNILQNKFIQKRGTIKHFCKTLMLISFQFIFDTLFEIYKENQTSTYIGTTTLLVNHIIESNSNAYKNLHETMIAHLFSLNFSNGPNTFYLFNHNISLAIIVRVEFIEEDPILQITKRD